MKRVMDNPVRRWVADQHRLLPAYLLLVMVVEAYITIKPF